MLWPGYWCLLPFADTNVSSQADSVFSGISTFGRLPYLPCLSHKDITYDIAFIGAPFDTGTSYRPGARFGPSGIRQGSRRLNL